MALNDIDAAVESFKKALALEPNDGQFVKSLIILLSYISLFLLFFVVTN